MEKQIPTAKDCALHGITEEIKYYVSLLGQGFHPDTDFADYEINGKPAFKAKQAKSLNARLDEAFQMADKYELDVYEITIEVMKSI